VLTARSFARRDEVIAANRELLALGVANAGSSLLQGFPVSSSASRTAIAVTTGSRTQLYSVIAAVAVVAVLLFARPVLAQFPVAALGAIVIYAAIRLIDVTAFRRLLAFRRTELAIALATCAGVLVFNILYGVLVAIGLSVADLLVRAARPHDAVLGRVSGLAGMHDVDDYPGAQTIPGLVVYRYDAPLFFANADYFRRRALAAASQEPGPPRWFVRRGDQQPRQRLAHDPPRRPRRLAVPEGRTGPAHRLAQPDQGAKTRSRSKGRLATGPRTVASAANRSPGTTAAAKDLAAPPPQGRRDRIRGYSPLPGAGSSGGFSVGAAIWPVRSR